LQAAENSDSESQYELANLLCDELENKREGLKWYKKAAGSGHLQAQLILAEMYYSPIYVEQDLNEALKWFLMAAEQGNNEAQFRAGELYYDNGMYTEALKWIKMSAESGYGEAQYLLGCMYAFGKGTSENIDEAAPWLVQAEHNGFFKEKNEELIVWIMKAANMGNPLIQLLLGKMYYDGKFLSLNYQAAAKWYRKASEQDLAEAQCRLGVLYECGLGIEQNFSEAIKWYRKSAQSNHIQGMTNLGLMYQKGLGVEKNNIEAENWFKMAENSEKIFTFLLKNP
jgi:TPR repeat protein